MRQRELAVFRLAPGVGLPIQEMALSQLPSELLEPIMELAGADSRRACVSVCRSLRGASISVTRHLTCTVGAAADLAALVAMSPELRKVHSVTIRPSTDALVDALLCALPGLSVGACATVILPEKAAGERLLRATLELPPDRRPALHGVRLFLGDNNHDAMRDLLLAARPHLDDVRLTMRRYDMELIRLMLPLTSHLEMDVRDAPPPEWANLIPTRPMWFGSSRMREDCFEEAVQPFQDVLESVTLDASAVTLSTLSLLFKKPLRTVKLHDRDDIGRLSYAFDSLEDFQPKELHVCGGWIEWTASKLAEQLTNLTFFFGFMDINNHALRALDHTLRTPGTLHIWAEGCARDDIRLADYFDIVQRIERTLSFGSDWQMPRTRAILAAKGFL